MKIFLFAAAVLFGASAMAQDIPRNLINRYDTSRLDEDGENCMAWYQRFLSDPEDVRYRIVSVEGTVFTIQIHARNYYGGRTVMRASCEIKNGRLDNGWTKIHAKRDGWLVN